jgi:hypothetical protein
MRNFAMGLLAATMLMSMGAPAAAQSLDAKGTPAFRVPIGATSQTTTAQPVYAWMQSISECSTTCGSGTRTTTYQCQNAADFDYSGGGYGAPEADASCTAAVGAKPTSGTASCANYSGCGYDWVKPAPQSTPVSQNGHPVGRLECGYVHQTFAPYCQRTGGGTTVVMPKSDYQYCRNDTPDFNDVASGNPDALGYDRTATITATCTPADHDWVGAGTWSDWSSTCSATATRTRTAAQCVRRFDGLVETDLSKCDAGSKPSTTETHSDFSGCSFSWTGGTDADWSPWSSTCSTSATRTRAVTCKRSDGTVVGDEQCVNAGVAKPQTSQTQGIYDSCSYSAGGTTSYSDWGSHCSASTTRTAHQQCVRSDNTVVADSECTNRGVPLDATQTSAVYDACGYTWTTDDWSDWTSHCSANATHTRGVYCRRQDGTILADQSQCYANAGTKPDYTQTQAVYDGCGYSASATQTSAWTDWSSHCSPNASRSRQHACQQSDGTIVDSSLCTNRGVNLTEGQNGAVYDGCGYGFQTGGWSDWSSHCSANATHSRAVTCVRSDGNAVDDSECTNRGQGRPNSSESSAVYDGCGYSTIASQYSACNSSGQQTRSVQCQRSDGAYVDVANCGYPGGTTNYTQGQSCTPPNTAWDSRSGYQCNGYDVSMSLRYERHTCSGQYPGDCKNYNREIGAPFTQAQCQAIGGTCIDVYDGEHSEYGVYETQDYIMRCVAAAPIQEYYVCGPTDCIQYQASAPAANFPN